MPWPCRLIETPELDEHGNVEFARRQVGDMWYLDLPEEELRKRELTEQYWRDNAPRRKPVVLALPILYYGGIRGVTPFLVDGKCFDSSRGHYDGWIVTGEAPVLTVSPSIHMVGRYHGWLREGVLSDDVDGRTF